MNKSATDVMQQIIFGAVVEAFGALKNEANGVPNTLMRELARLNNANTTFADLPKSVQQAIRSSTYDGFKVLLKEGFAIGPRGEVRSAPRAAAARPQKPRKKPSVA